MKQAQPATETAPPAAIPPALVRRPERQSDHAYWQAHIPFAFWLVEALRPRLVVELGVYKGDSYCAFCQAVAENRIPAKCFGVDNWRGDIHYGEYGAEVLWELKQHHDARYSAFSQLIRADFEDALALFSDETIDLLHIDGTHTYEAAKRDFDLWLPKMSPRGVVLLHDINERRPEYGVWRLWEELATRHPAFEFTHSSGLGVIKARGEPVPEIDWLFGRDDARTVAFRTLAATIGEGWQSATRTRNAERERDGLYNQLQEANAKLAATPTEPPPASQASLAAVAKQQNACESRLAAFQEDTEARLEALRRESEARHVALESALRATQAALAPLGDVTTSHATQLAQLALQVAEVSDSSCRAGVAMHERVAELYQRAQEAYNFAGAIGAKVNDQEGAVWTRLAHMETWLRSFDAAQQELDKRYEDRGAAQAEALARERHALRREIQVARLEASRGPLGALNRIFGGLTRRSREARDRRDIESSGFFDASFYLATCPDAATSGLDPLTHYLRVGSARGANPGPRFDANRYGRAYPDVFAVGMDPLLHYVRHGRAEGRAVFDVR